LDINSCFFFNSPSTFTLWITYVNKRSNKARNEKIINNFRTNKTVNTYTRYNSDAEVYTCSYMGNSLHTTFLVTDLLMNKIINGKTNILVYWVFGLCPITCPVMEVSSFQRAQQSRQLPPPQLRMERHPVSETLCSLEHGTLDKSKNPVIPRVDSTSAKPNGF
jgi:hypothetical protein